MGEKDKTVLEIKAVKEELEKEFNEKLEREKIELRKKAEEWSEKKSEEKALELFNKEKEISNDMKVFNDEQIRLGWLHEQGALPEGDTAGQIMMKIRIGKQLGLNEYQSITGLAFIKGKLAIWGKVFVGLITSAGYKINFDKWTNETCKCTISKGDESMTDEYTIKDAKEAGLYPSNAYSPWTKHTKKMLAYKVVNNISSFLCPHIIGGALIADDARDELRGEKEEIEAPTQKEIQNNINNKFANED